jgi:hypothetical protein
MTYVHIYAPPVASRFVRLNRCPTCDRDRRMLGEYWEWYGTTWTCLGCGDRWADDERLERPFCAGWRQMNVRRARAAVEKMGMRA